MADGGITSAAGVSGQEFSGGGGDAWAGVAKMGADILTSAYNVYENRRNRKIHEQREDNAHRREMADLAAAGLNPILTGKGQGAQSGMNTAAQIHSVDPLQTQLIKAQINDINSASILKQAQTKLATEERALKAGQGMALQPEIDTYQERKDAIKEHLRQIQLLNSHSAYDMERSKQESKFEAGWQGSARRWLRLAPNVNPIILRGIPQAR